MTGLYNEDNDIKKLISIVFSDVEIARNLVEKDDSQYNRRSYIRAAFAAVEGLTYVLKQQVIKRPDFHSGIYSAAEMALLNEESYSLNNKAEAVTKVSYLPTADNFRFTLNMYLRGSSSFELNLGDGGWDYFNKALKIRHRIIHPKRPNEFFITDKDIEIFNNGYSWFNWVIVSALINAVEYLNDRSEQLKKANNSLSDKLG